MNSNAILNVQCSCPVDKDRDERRPFASHIGQGFGKSAYLLDFQVKTLDREA